MTPDQPSWTWTELLAADVGRAVAWVTPSVAGRVPTAARFACVPPAALLPGDLDTLVVIGGGTLIDKAKSAARDREQSVQLIAVATIWGSGAEASPVVVLDREGKKEILIDDKYRPDRRVIWEEVATSIPTARAKLACGDCWAHALEGFLSPLAGADVRAELVETMRQMLAVPLSNDARWFELSARACAGQARSSVGLTHGIAHTLEGPLRQAQPEEDWHHARLCSAFLWPVMCLNRTRSEKWSQLVGDQDLDFGAVDEVLRTLFDREGYEKALPTLVQHWRAVLRDRCTRTNSVLVRPTHLRYFEERAFL